MMPFASAFLRAAVPFVMIFALIGCDGTLRQSEDVNASADARTVQLTNDFYSRPPIRAGGAQLSNANFVAPESVPLKSSDRLPASAETSTSVVLISRDPLTLVDIASRLSQITNIQHTVAFGASGQVAQAGAVAAGSPDAAPTPATSQAIRPNLRGSLSSVLDKVASSFDVEWTYKNGRVVFSDFVTRQYQLSAFNSQSSTSNSVIETSTTSSLDMWSELSEALVNLVGSDAKVAIGQGTGILTVTASLSDQERVRDYVTTMNQTMGQQIAFDVNVLTLASRAEEGFGVEIDQLSYISGSNTVDWIGGERLNDSVGRANVGIISGNLNLDAVISALSTRRRVTLETRAGATTTNFQMVPVEVVNETNYVSSVSNEVDDNGLTTTTVETDTVTTGFQLQLLPRILNSKEVMLRYSLDLSDLVGLETFTSSETSVQLPEVTRSSFEQQVILKNGQTLVLSGFERQRTEVDRSGVGNPRFIALGGKAKGDITRASSIVFITPRLLSRGLATN
jgi:type II secretory pathway component GspD/PulD (secretin)